MTKKPEPDMSTEAIEARLEQLRALYRFGVSLREIRPTRSDDTK